MFFPIPNMLQGSQPQTKKALVLIDFQNDFISSAGRLPVENTASFVDKLPFLVDRFREGGEIVWVRTEYRHPQSTISDETGGYVVLLKQFLPYLPTTHDGSSLGYAASRPENDVEHSAQSADELQIEPDGEAFLAVDLPTGDKRCCQPGTIGSEITEVLKRAVDSRRDLVVTKTTYSALADMTLVFQLRTRMVTDLYLCGSLSNVSVYATALDAVRHGFNVTVIEDCLGYRDEQCHVQAMRQMADNMCVEGVDYQELLDDLAGLLGDVVREEDYTARYHVDISRPTRADRDREAQSRQHVSDWINQLQNGSRTVKNRVERRTNSVPDSPAAGLNHGSYGDSSASPARSKSYNERPSPVRKRSTEQDEEADQFDTAQLLQQVSARRGSVDSLSATTENRVRRNKVKARRSSQRPEDAAPERRRSIQAPSSAMPDHDIPPARSLPPPPPLPPLPPPPPEDDLLPTGSSLRPRKRLDKKSSQYFLGPGDPIGDGHSEIVHRLLADDVARKAFYTLRSGIAWQKMYHRSGEVPRLVAVQGDVVELTSDQSKTYPIYRHPADESPEVRPFDDVVEMLRQVCERQVGHPLNHVLIQHYRSGDDNISEHSDKTLDIARGSNIVNLSLGAMRTMTLRTKRAVDTTPKSRRSGTTANLEPSSLSASQPRPFVSANEDPGPPRLTQRIQLPHNSLFILTPGTNSRFLHAVKADKRPFTEKSGEELDFDGERISLTFRHIGTFITEYAAVTGGRKLIWGQGATGKSRKSARDVLISSSVSPPPPTPHYPVLPPSVNGHANSGNTSTKPPLSSHPCLHHHNHHHPDYPHHQPPSSPSLVHAALPTKSEADIQAEQIIIAFGRENHEADCFDWDRMYGSGFDVVNFTVTPAPNPDSNSVPASVVGASSATLSAIAGAGVGAVAGTAQG